MTNDRRGPAREHRAHLVWLTGLPAAGKSTVAGLVLGKVHAVGARACVLDGDELRRRLNRDLGFGLADREENVRRAAEIARLMVGAGLVVVVAIISPFRDQRDRIRATFAPGQFSEVFVDAPLEVVERRDPKGLYRRARLGELKEFTGVDSPYEPPLTPEVHLHTDRHSPEECAQQVFVHLRRAGVLGED